MISRKFFQTVVSASLVLCSLPAFAQTSNGNATPVTDYSLPELLITNNGESIRTQEDWENLRRPELLSLFAGQMYGRLPLIPVEAIYQVRELTPNGGETDIIRKQVEITLSRNGETRKSLLLMYLPAQAEKAVPVFLAPNFKGNQTITTDSAVIYSQYSDQERGIAQSRWPVQTLINAGYGLVTFHYFDFYPDDPNRATESILPLFTDTDYDKNPDDNGQALSAWAWGMSQIMDYLQNDDQVNADQVILMGHSRLGKAALWAGAQDVRFAMVISNNSGCGGAALSKRVYGETVQQINNTFPHWFCQNFAQYNNREQEMPFDQHQLLALIAPRPLYVASATEDQWADPEGEFLAAREASKAYSVYGLEAIGNIEMPAVNEPVQKWTGYHIRSGKHDVTDYDWDNWIIFANKWFK